MCSANKSIISGQHVSHHSYFLITFRCLVMYLDAINDPNRLGVGSVYCISLTKGRQVLFFPATPELLDDVGCLFLAIACKVSWLAGFQSPSVTPEDSPCGSDVMRQPLSRCAGVKGTGSSIAEDVCDKGRSLKTASISVTIVCYNFR
ncbi:hypothetical protein DPMN_124963 [Dreissena polymorpha]|uniref:Uncharacterized protein n=1 Tax=Dreissena polymorpha TaxID=45954 RepID=A0A9D4GTJ9_DREPO|nr:hypothetical protein DPMN_124963 [Dreissena polymorpha]